MLDKRVTIGGKIDVTPEMVKAAKAAGGLDDSFTKLKDALIEVNKNGTRVAATMKFISDDFREATVDIEKFFSGSQRGWQATNVVIKQNEQARQKANEQLERQIALQERANKQQLIEQQRTNKIGALLNTREIPKTATTFEVANYNNAIAKVQEYARVSGVSIAAINAEWARLNRGEVASHSGRLNDLQQKLIGVRASYNKLGSAATAEIDRLNKNAGQFLLTWQSVARIFAANIIRRALFAITGQIRESVTAAKDLEIRISEIRTIAQDVQLPFEQWATGLRELSDSFGFDILDQAEAAYQTLSNQVAKGTDVFEFLAEANKFARTAVTDTATSVDLLTGAINAYRLNAEDAEAVSAILFKTIELGRVRASDMSSSFGDVAILANQLGITLNELTAAIDTLTIQGVKYNKAATQLRGIFVKLVKPSKDMLGFLREMGFETGEAAIKTLGFGEFIRRLQERTKGSSTELAKYITRVRGLSGQLAFSGKGFDIYTKAIEENQKALESYQRAQKIAMESAGFTVEKELKKIKNYFTEEFGRSILNTLADVTSLTGGIVPILRAMTTTIKILGATAIPILAALAAKWAAVKYEALQAAIAQGKVSASFAGILKNSKVLIATEFVAIYAIVSSLVEKELEEIRKEDEQFFKNRVDNHKRNLNKIIEQDKKYTKEYLKALDDRERLTDQAAAEIVKTNNAAIDASIEVVDTLSKAIEEAFKGTEKELDDQIKRFKDIEDAATSNIKKITSSVIDLSRTIDKDLFEIKLDGVEKSTEKIALINGRLKELQQLTQVALVFEDVDRVQELIKERYELEKQITKISQETSKNNKKAEEERRKIVLEINKEQQKLKGTTGKEANDVKKKIFDLQKELQKVTTEDLGDYFDNYEVRYKKLLEEAKTINKQIIDDQVKNAQEAAKKRIALELQVANITELVTQFRKFDINEVVESKDIDTITKALTKQRDALFEIIDAQEQLGVESIDISKLRTKLSEEAIIGQKSIANITIEEANRSREAIIQAIKDSEEARSKLFKQASANLASGVGALQTFAQGKLVNIFGAGAADAVEVIQPFADVLQQLKTNSNIEEVFKNLLETRKQIVGLNLPTSTNQKALSNLDTVAKQLDAVLRAQRVFAENNVSTAKTGIEVNKEFDQLLKEIKGTVVDVAQAEVQAERQRTDGLKRAIDLAEQYRKSLEQIRGILTTQQITQPAIDTFANGGRVAPRGSDRIPALLSPGEFVMNAQSTKKFYGQLLSMNSGVHRFSNGGSVTNVGDINVNLTSSGSEAVDVVRIGKGLRRAIRRGKVQL